MKIFKALWSLPVVALSVFNINCFKAAEKPDAAKSGSSFYDLNYVAIDGKPVNFSQYKGKKVLIVNVASKCGYTSQYDDLEKLSNTFGEKVVVVGFPANDFMGQEPGTNEEIAAFCKTSFSVDFPMSQKISVVGEGKHPVYKWLTTKSLNGWNEAEPKWNFFKYLIDEKGELLAVFPSKTKPLDAEITKFFN